jgi:hypothetical protein
MNRFDVVLVGVVAVTIVAESLIVRTIDGTNALNILVGGLGGLPSAIGLIAWRRRQRSWIAALSWTIPLLGWMALCFSRNLPVPLASAGAVAGGLFALLMSGVDEVAERWYRYVLRSDMPRS